MAKALLWRAISIVITSTIVALMTGNFVLGASVGVGDTLVKLIAYCIFERVWENGEEKE